MLPNDGFQWNVMRVERNDDDGTVRNGLGRILQCGLSRDRESSVKCRLNHKIRIVAFVKELHHLLCLRFEVIFIRTKSSQAEKLRERNVVSDV